LFSTSTDGLRIAATLLHGERSQDDRGNTMLVAVLLEDPNKPRAGLERAGRGLESRGQRLGYYILHANKRWFPSAGSFKSTVQPINVTVRARESGDLPYEAGIRRKNDVGDANTYE
jgi:hypothetical protein